MDHSVNGTFNRAHVQQRENNMAERERRCKGKLGSNDGAEELRGNEEEMKQCSELCDVARTEWRSR